MSESVLGVSKQILDCCYAAYYTCVYDEYVLDIQDFHKRIIELIGIGIIEFIGFEP